MKKLLLCLFFICAVSNIFFEALVSDYPDYYLLVFLSKPLLMPLLLAYFLASTKNISDRYKKYISLALVFAFLGDTTLMLVEHPPKEELFFLVGLASFLIAHIAYLLGFYHIVGVSKSIFKQTPLLILPFVAFWASFIYLLWADIPSEMLVPVIVYATAIVIMVACATNLYRSVGQRTYIYILLGAISFLLSDLCIGINKFKYSIYYARPLIMLLYLVGQYLIVEGSSLYLKKIKQ